MDGAAFDRMVRRLELAAGRRTLLAGLAAAGLAGGTVVIPDLAAAKKKKKKVTICRKGETLSVTKKKKQKHLKPGDTAGPCPATTRPPATTAPPPRCPPRVPNFCARLDSCEPSCAAGHAFDAESCACVCSPATTCCVCTRGQEILDFPNTPSQEACADACTAAGGTGPVFAGGEGNAAVPHPTEAQCTVTCTVEEMTCPAGVNPATCPAGQVCCSVEDGDGCCFVDAPVCCGGGGCCGRGGVCCDNGNCCSVELPLCCGTSCCLEDSACCTNNGDCDTGQSCSSQNGIEVGCCLDDPERARGSRSASLAPMSPVIPRRRRGR